MITIEVEAMRAQRVLGKLARQLDDRRGVNKDLSIKLQEMVFRNFDNESHDGAPWAGLAPSTLRARERRQKKVLTLAKILQVTGALRASFLPFHDNDLAGVGAVSMKGSVPGDPPGAKRPWDLAKIHEEGLGHVPARPMLPGRALALEKAVNIYGWFVERAVREAK